MKKTAAVLSFALLLACFVPLRVGAAIATDTITIRVGYAGGPYYEKAVLDWRELDDLYGGALDTHSVTYSYSNGGRTAICAARGFYLTDLLEYAGVDISGVLTIAFYTDDQSVGAWTSFQKDELLDRPRYYYPNISADGEGGLMPREGGALEDGAERVACMLALEDNWEWDAIAPNFSLMSATGRFHLLFGQAYPEEARTMQAAKYVHQIDVTFAGSPVFGAEDNLDLTVGQDYRVQVNVAAADSMLEDYIAENLVWSSNNTEVAEADLYGNLTLKSAGEAVISAAYGDSVVSVKLIVAPDESGSPSSAAPGAAPPEPGPALPPEPEPAPPAEETSVEDPPPEETAAEEPPAEEVAYSEHDRGVYILSDTLMAQTKFAEWVNSVLAHSVSVDSDKGDVMNWRKQAMAEDAVQLILEKPPARDMSPWLLGFCLLFLSGAATGAISYHEQRKEKRK